MSSHHVLFGNHSVDQFGKTTPLLEVERGLVRGERDWEDHLVRCSMECDVPSHEPNRESLECDSMPPN